MSEKIGNYHFERAAHFNPYDRYISAVRLAQNTSETLGALVKEAFEKQGNISVQPYLADDRVVLAEEIMDELISEIRNREIEVTDEILFNYLNATDFTIDDERYDVRQDVPWFKILKAIGIPKKVVKDSYDMCGSKLPEEHMHKSDMRLDVIEEVYGKETE